MNNTWIEYCRKSDIAQDSIPFSHSDWFNWLDYAAKNYAEPMTLSPLSDWND